MPASAEVCVLGAGTMGGCFVRRLRERGRAVSVWNRTPAAAEALAAEGAQGPCRAERSAAAAISACPAGSAAIAILVDTAAVLSLLGQDGVGEALRGRTFVNLASGNPDDGRRVRAAVAEASGGGAAFVDGAYCGPPARARAGAGQLFLSSAGPEVVSPLQPLLSELGSVTFCGDVGTSRAVDYAVVDLFFVNVLAFMSNKAMLEREGVDLSAVLPELAKRLDSVPASIAMYDKKMASREEGAYESSVSVSLDTAHSYWTSRLPYYQARGMPTHLADFYAQLLEAAGARGPGGAADLARLQEVVRYGPAAAPRGGAATGGCAASDRAAPY